MSGMAGGGDTGNSTQTTKVELPAWVDKQAQETFGRAKDVADRPYAAYKGPTVAPLSQEFYQAQGMLPGLDDYFGNYQGATDTYNRNTNFDARDVNAPTVRADMLRDTDLNPYLNPWIENVENRTTDRMLQAGEQQQNKIRSDASAAKSFGGSRQAIQQAVQGAETNRGIGDMAAQLRMQGYDKATANAIADLDRKLKAETQTGAWNIEGQKANQQADILGAQVQNQAAQGLTQTADSAQKAKMNEILQYLGIGQMSQDQKQREYDDAKGKWQDKRDYPMEMVNFLMAAMGMTPYGKTETSNKTSETQKGGDMFGAAGSIMQMIPGFMAMSDRTTKTDIEELGIDPVTDLPMYAYRYKKDPKTYPKAVGPMAQDVEKKYPQLVRKIAGKKVIDLTGLAA